MQKRLLSEILWEAANRRLSAEYESTDQFVTASCCAAYWAERGREWWDDQPKTEWASAAKRSKAVQFLKSLGCRVGVASAFARFQHGHERQGVRYMWLLLAMHVAADEGIEV